MRRGSLFSLFVLVEGETSPVACRTAPSPVGDLAPDAATVEVSKFPVLKSPRHTMQVSDIRLCEL